MPARLTAEQRSDRAMSEVALSKEFNRLRKDAGWRAHNVVQGWNTRTAMRGDRGFPDWFLVRGDRAIAVELKDEQGELEPLQELWAAALNAAGVDYHLFRPSDLRLGVIEEILR